MMSEESILQANNNLVLDHSWIPVENNNGIPYHFPDPSNLYLRDQWKKPAVYRWVIYQDVPGDLRKLYIGETDKLTRRISNYRNPDPSQKTNHRIHHLFGAELENGNKIILESLHFQPFEIYGVPVSMADLEFKSVRCFLENMFITCFVRQGYELLNT